ncbi:glycosyltransferase family 4 protein [Candidatus Parcubacteria bacterium]|nr:glycosyltransferase family 4 protein [Candidatus Parcubacteria bacterium]
MKPEPKIAFITPLYLPAKFSGSGVVIQQLATELARRGYDCSVITSDGLTTRAWYDPICGKRIEENFEIIKGVKVYRLPCRRILSFFYLAMVRYFRFLLPRALFNKLELLYSGPNLVGLTNLLQEEKFDIIHSSPFPTYSNKQAVDSAARLAPRPKLMIMPCFHSFLPDYHNPELGKILTKADLIHVFTNAEKEDLQKIFRLPDEKFAIVPLFLDLSKMTRPEKSEVARFKERFNLIDKKIILFAGSKIHLKGIFTLTEAIKKLHEKDPTYALITIGNGNPGWEKYKKKTNPAFLIDLGYVSEKQKEVAFGACDIFCLPSICESFGLVYLEAWHKRKPVIGANIPVVRELITNAQGGLLVEFGNEEALAETIQKLARSPRLAEELGQSGYRTLTLEYNLLKVLPKFENFLKNV